MSDNQACEVPLVELLRGMPADHAVIINIPKPNGFDSSLHIPAGRLMHEAADRIDQLERENAALRTKLEEAERKLAAAAQRMKEIE